MPTALITGANSGIGQAAATDLARRGWRVFATARSRERGLAALEQIRAAGGSENVELIQLDLASFASVREAAEDVLNRADQLDVLINNAGVNLSQRTLTEDGLESTMQVNHFGHFLLTSLLLSRILEAEDPRIVNVSSMLYKRAGAMPFDDLQLERNWGRGRPYAVSKLANVLFTRALHRRYFAQRLAVYAVHPGGVRSRLGADGDLTGLFGFFWRLLQPLLLSPEKGAAPIVAAAHERSLRIVAGAYFNRHNVQQLNRHASDATAADRLWEISNELTKAEWPDA